MIPADTDSAVAEQAEAPVALSGYQTFRKELLTPDKHEASRKFVRSYLADGEATPEPHPISVAKARIRKARQHLSSGLGSDRPAGDQHLHARRLLGIPAATSSAYPAWLRVGMFFLPAFIPFPLTLALIRAKLQGVRSYEGRKVVFDGTLKHLLYGLDYTPSIDYAVRRLEGSAKYEDFKKLQYADEGWLDALRRLGVTSVSEMSKLAASEPSSEDRMRMQLLVAAGVLTSLDEVKSWSTPPRYAYRTQHGTADERVAHRTSASAVLQQLMALGVSKASILRAFQEGGPDFLPEQLAKNAAALERRNVSVVQTFEAIGHFLWSAQPKCLLFVLNDLGVQTPADIGRFNELLESRGTPSAALAKALVASGASPADLASCQAVLLAAADLRDESDAVEVFTLLSLPPFAFKASDFAHVREFLRRSEHLPDNLAEIAKWRLTEPADVLAFQRCNLSIAPTIFGRLLTLAMNCRHGEQIETVVDWIRRAAAIGDVRACEELVTQLKIASLADLERSLSLAPLGAYLLSYLIVNKKLNSLSRLMRWFYTDARGVLDLKLHHPLKEIERLLLDDAFARGDFSNVTHNISCAYAASRRRGEAVLGPRPHFQAEEACAKYESALEQTRAADHPQLLLDMQRMLDETQGVLLSSVLGGSSGDPNALARRLSAVSPLIDDLVAGGGPTGTPSELETEAIALVYRTTPGTVTEHWSRVQGRQADIAGLKLAPSYPMRWQRAHRQLRENRQLDERGFLALTKAAHLAQSFHKHAAQDMSQAVHGLRPSRFGDPAADVNGLAGHLAVLCGLVLGNSDVADAMGQWATAHQALGGGPTAFATVEQLQSFFETTLPDALGAGLEARLAKLSRVDAELLASRLGPKLDQFEDPIIQLKNALTSVRQWILPKYAAWAKAEHGKFVTVSDELGFTTLTAVLTKMPAAFFAKQAARLCTRDDTDMWNEVRQSHLVVFDPIQRRLAGMAMVYVERIESLDAGSNTLVLRALNPMEHLAATHSIQSIVDAYIAIAIEIARANDLAAVAIPSTGGHLLSNVFQVERDLVTRHIQPARTWLPPSHERQGSGVLTPPWEVKAKFDGYTRGQGLVSTLYVLWLNPRVKVTSH